MAFSRFFVLFLTPLSLCFAEPTERSEGIKPVVRALVDPTFYLGAGSSFTAARFLSQMGHGLCHLFPSLAVTENEWLIASDLFHTAASGAFARAWKTAPLLSLFHEPLDPSCSAWEENSRALLKVVAHSGEDRELLSFLQRRWLGKITGCYPFLVNWMCPAFGISYQVHPETTNSYARDPWNKRSETYLLRVEEWKRQLPHPDAFPLILTRPAPIEGYLPNYTKALSGGALASSMEQLKAVLSSSTLPVLLDLSLLAPDLSLGAQEWLSAWSSLEEEVSQLCRARGVDLERVLCVQQVQQQGIWGMRILPLSSCSREKSEELSQFLLEWVSRFGLSANRVELDRLSDVTYTLKSVQKTLAWSPQSWRLFLDALENSWHTPHPQKTQMFLGTLALLKGLCSQLSEGKCMRPFHIELAEICFAKIQSQLEGAAREQEEESFHAFSVRLEQVCADIASLLEIFDPFSRADFLFAYQELLTCIPESLKPLTDYALHMSAMTSLGGIFKAVEKSLGKPLCILFGDNAYFEAIDASGRTARALSTKEATAHDWEQVDLLLAQFNPTVKRVNFEVTEYQVCEYHAEDVAEMVTKALKARGGRPLYLALDCTLDHIDSPRVAKLLQQFQEEIEKGSLAILCYRSGLKFDLLGMDNYCGAPFFMIHNRAPQWTSLAPLLTDPALQTDRLSTHWFSLAYRYAAPFLHWYEQQIFDNTRALLDQTPPELYRQENTRYRVVPIDRGADPTFIDIKIFGPLHTFRGNLFVGTYLTVKCMAAGFPLFFRPGVGFYHPNLAVLFGKECTTVRLTVGLDPAQIGALLSCLEKLAACERAAHISLGNF